MLPLLITLLLPLLFWSLFWKGLALWHAGQRGQGWWFVIVLVVNTVGILELVYLFAILNLKPSQLFSKKD
ncbi:MAG: DUF5652 family protein [Candidatus Moraniibacteriota bacterium]